MNAVILTGTVVRDPQMRTTQKGTAVAGFTVMTVRRFGKQMEFEGKDYINCVAWGNEAQKVGNYVKANTPVEIKGRIGSRSYEQNGEKKYVTEVNVESLDILGQAQNTGFRAEAPQNAGYDAPQSFSQFGTAMDEQVPF